MQSAGHEAPPEAVSLAPVAGAVQDAERPLLLQKNNTNFTVSAF